MLYPDVWGRKVGHSWIGLSYFCHCIPFYTLTHAHKLINLFCRGRIALRDSLPEILMDGTFNNLLNVSGSQCTSYFNEQYFISFSYSVLVGRVRLIFFFIVRLVIVLPDAKMLYVSRKIQWWKGVCNICFSMFMGLWLAFKVGEHLSFAGQFIQDIGLSDDAVMLFLVDVPVFIIYLFCFY